MHEYVWWMCRDKFTGKYPFKIPEQIQIQGKMHKCLKKIWLFLVALSPFHSVRRPQSIHVKEKKEKLNDN